MRWSIVFVIFRREVRDQVRDRRTLFMIFVLPILLYPMLGIGVVQFSAAFEQKPRTALVIGSEFLPTVVPLLNAEKNGFDVSLFDSPDEASKLRVRAEPAKPPWLDASVREQAIRNRVAEAVVVIPPDFMKRLEEAASSESVETPILYDSTDEPSQITNLRVKEVLSRWKKKIVSARLERDQKPASYTEPIAVKSVDIASESEVGGSVWSRLFPFLLVMMSLTGAFYPAIDLCAGEKERGTMETLLISPASRAEIVMGKFFTVVLASMMTALLNLVSMGLTGIQLANQVSGIAGGGHRRLSSVIAPPTFTAAFWMLLLLIPLSVFFSAICLSLAVLAKSMKEGQYYMTPLYLVCLPLIFLTLAPGIELNLFYSLVPVTGVSLLLRALILGDYANAWRYFLPVLVPTIVYGAIALRWAIDQFQREDVLFREAERFELKSWLRHLLRDKEPTPNGGEALLCFVLMLTSAWFLIQYLTARGLGSSTTIMAAGQVAFILTPPLAMAFVLTSSPRRTLRLFWPKTRYLLLAIGLAFSLNPLVNELRPRVEQLFPVSPLIKAALDQMMTNVPSLGVALLLFAVIPAICEEFAFRGYILTGLESRYSARSAILLQALLFGFLHVLLSLFQQLFNATLLGLVLGLLAVRSGSIVPGIVFHMLNNGMAVLLGSWISDPSTQRVANWFYRDPKQGLFHYGIVVAGGIASVYLIALLSRASGEGKLKPPSSESGSLEALHSLN
ncbi:sodium transport system permease protein [Singulisphaera sp. GP187]|uniref:ABC transporter permease subunit/CPBP intramembrane protease n=1 Tax=Singulisphaera sp. GP187 TaxID=1882752 RepID=UPI000927B068|nr:ABC transporter permease subunit/CPBP intramembrane protease [Singulisphaera sp. GP187]SIO01201.1 sodium transport system permease protein [Singulisphaera sp. GP187]